MSLAAILDLPGLWHGREIPAPDPEPVADFPAPIYSRKQVVNAGKALLKPMPSSRTAAYSAVSSANAILPLTRRVDGQTAHSGRETSSRMQESFFHLHRDERIMQAGFLLHQICCSHSKPGAMDRSFVARSE